MAFGWGVAGAAGATVLAQFVSGIGITVYTLIRFPEFRLSREELHFDKRVLGEIAQLSFLTCLQQSVMNFGILMVQGRVNSFGTAVMAAFAAAAVIVSCVRRLSVDHARTIAIVLGIAVQLGVICSGEIYLGETGRIVRVILGCMVSLVIALVLDFMILSVDYSRVEHTQFEDDEYYYYVRAVPRLLYQWRISRSSISMLNGQRSGRVPVEKK